MTSFYPPIIDGDVISIRDKIYDFATVKQASCLLHPACCFLPFAYYLFSRIHKFE